MFLQELLFSCKELERIHFHFEVMFCSCMTQCRILDTLEREKNLIFSILQFHITLFLKYLVIVTICIIYYR